jgi:hypothetical protein
MKKFNGRNDQLPFQGRGHSQTRVWRHFEAVEYDTQEWVDWFNNRRLLEPIRSNLTS